MTTAYVGVGSNVDPEANVPAALRLLTARVRVIAVSTFYRTAPWGAPGSPPFVNGTCAVETADGPRELKFDVLRGIERALGRVRAADKYAPRTIDLDVLLHGDAVLEEGDLIVPDPEIRTRPFVALPLLELDPELVLPGTGRRLAELVRGMSGAELEPLPELTRRLREEVGR